MECGYEKWKGKMMEFYGVTWEEFNTYSFDVEFPRGDWSPVVALSVHDSPLGFGGIGVTRFVVGYWDGGELGHVVTSQEVDATGVVVARVASAAAAFRLIGDIVDRDGIEVFNHTHGLHA